MARDLNLWIGTGRLGRTPEIKMTPSNKAVCSVSMACAFDDKVEWVNLVFWDKHAELLEKYCDKGSFIRVSGRIQSREWTTKDGAKRTVTEIVATDLQFLTSKQDSADPNARTRRPEPSHNQDGPVYPEPPEDDIPF